VLLPPHAASTTDISITLDSITAERFFIICISPLNDLTA
jgi:hypothetical protein